MNLADQISNQEKIGAADGVTPRRMKEDSAMNDKNPKYVNSLVLNFLQPCFRKKPDANQQFLDIGCSRGEFTRNGLLPQCLPCRRIVAVDLSQDQLNQAQELFPHPKIEYVFLDIGKDVSDFVRQYGHFDRIYSFGCLHMTNLDVSFENIEKLMTPGGECLLLFAIGCRDFEWWRQVVQKERWNKYIEVLEAVFPKAMDTRNIAALLDQISGQLEALKLKPHTCEYLSEERIGQASIDNIIKTVRAQNPLAQMLSEEENREIEKEIGLLVRDTLTAERASRVGGRLFHHILIHASKPRS